MTSHGRRPHNRGMILLLRTGPGTDAVFLLLATADGSKSKRRICGPIYSPSLDISVGFALDDTDSAASQRPTRGFETRGRLTPFGSLDRCLPDHLQGKLNLSRSGCRRVHQTEG